MLDRVKIDALDIRPKILIAFVLVALLVGITGAVGYYGVGVVEDSASAIATDAEKINAATEMSLAVEKQQQAILYAERGSDLEATERFANGRDLFAAGIETFRAAELSDEEATLVASLETTHAEYESTATAAIDAAEAGNMQLAEARADEAQSLSGELEQGTSELYSIQTASMETQVAAADQTTQNTQTGMVGLTILAFIAAITIGLFVAHRISTPIAELSEAAVAASQGDLTKAVTDHVEDDEIGRMVGSFQRMQADLRAIFDDLESVSEGLAKGNVDNDVDTDYAGAYGQLMRNLDEATTQLNESFDEIQQASEELRDQTFDNEIETDRAGRYGDVLHAVEEGIKQINQSLLTVQEIAEEVAEASDETAATAKAVDNANQVVASSVDDLEGSSTDVAESVAEITAGTKNRQRVCSVSPRRWMIFRRPSKRSPHRPNR